MPGWLDRFSGADDKAPALGRNDLEVYASAEDPFVALHRAFSRPDLEFRMPLALARTHNLITTDDRHQCMILGPPRCFKSTGVLAPQVLTAPGPVVSTSTKPDMYRATGLARSRKGFLWHLNLDPDIGLLPGCKELRWSPVTASIDWGMAQGAGYGLASSAETQDMANAGYFRNRAGELISCLLHAAALAEYDLGWVMSGVAGSDRVLAEAQAILERNGHPLSVDPLRGLTDLEPRSRDPIFSTAQTAFICYRDPEGYASTQNPNFDPAAFVAGQPTWGNQGIYTPNDWAHHDAGIEDENYPRGMYDTVYINAPTTKQTRVAALITGLLGAIRQATFSQYARYELDREPPRPPVFWALDECASIAPLSDLPETGAQAAGQGLLVSIVLQDLAQAERRWQQDSKSFRTLFADQVIFPGIANNETLDAYSELFGKEWVSRQTTSVTYDHKGKKPSMTVQNLEELLPVLEPADIAHGGKGDRHDPRRVLVSKNAGAQWDWAYCLPYFNTPPFTQALVASMEFASYRRSVWDLRTGALMPRFGRDTDESTRNLHSAGGDALLQRAYRLVEVQASVDVANARAQQLIERAPLMKGWTGDRGFSFMDFGTGVALVVLDQRAELADVLEGFTVESWDQRNFSWINTAPDTLVHWELEKAWFHAGHFVTPSAIDSVISEFDAMLAHAEKPSLFSVLNQRPASVIVYEISDRVGNWIARKTAELYEAPVFIDVLGNVEVRK